MLKTYVKSNNSPSALKMKFAWILLLSSFLTANFSYSQDRHYTVKMLDVDSDSAHCTRITDNGDVFCQNDERKIWQCSSGLIYNLETGTKTLVDVGACANDMNNQGQVVLNGGKIWQDGDITSLPDTRPSLPFGLFSPYWISDGGHVLGFGATQNGGDLTVLYTPEEGQYLQLWDNGTPYAVNSVRQAVGTRYSVKQKHRVVLWDNGVLKDITPTYTPNREWPIPYAINDSGLIVVGTERIDSTESITKTYLYNLNTENYTRIEYLNGFKYAGSMGINNHGQVVGILGRKIISRLNTQSLHYKRQKTVICDKEIGCYQRQPFIYKDGVMKKLDQLIDNMPRGLKFSEPETVFSINSNGQILVPLLNNRKKLVYGVLTPL